MLAIVKAAKEYKKLDASTKDHLEAIEINEAKKKQLIDQWGDSLARTVVELNERESRKESDPA
jgi:hypothetical protein